MAFSNSLLLDTADAIQDTLGGIYLGAIFESATVTSSDANSNARMIWWRLVHEVLRFSTDDTLKLENNTQQANQDPNSNMRKLLAFPWSYLPDETPQSTTSTSPQDIHSTHRLPRDTSHFAPSTVSQYPSLHLHRRSRSKPLTLPSHYSYAQFPCTFFLSDFPSQTALLHLRNSYDGVQMRKFLIPFLDAMVVGKAREVVGTKRSTYSRFVQDVFGEPIMDGRLWRGVERRHGKCFWYKHYSKLYTAIQEYKVFHINICMKVCI